MAAFLCLGVGHENWTQGRNLVRCAHGNDGYLHSRRAAAGSLEHREPEDLEFNLEHSTLFVTCVTRSLEMNQMPPDSCHGLLVAEMDHACAVSLYQA